MSRNFISLAVAVIGIVAAAGVYAAVTDASKPKAQTPGAQRAAVAREMRARVRAPLSGPLVSLGDDFTVNLADPGLRHFTRFALVMQVDAATPLVRDPGPPAVDRLSDEPQVRDIVIADASRYTAAQLQSPAGRQRLKDRIRRDVEAQTDTLPLAVYFTSFAMQ